MLIVVDMQEDFCAKDGAYAKGGMDISGTRDILPNVRRLMHHAQEIGVPSVATLFTIYTDMQGDGLVAPALLKKRPFLRDEGFRLGSTGQRLSRELSEAKYEIIKPRYSAFYATPLDILVRTLGVTHVTITGITTGGGVAATARDAHLRDLQVTIVSDAVASPKALARDFALVTLQEVGESCETDAWIDARGTAI